MKRMRKAGLASKLAAWILSAALVFSMCPVQVRAQEGDANAQDTIETVLEESTQSGEEEEASGSSQTQEAESAETETTEAGTEQSGSVETEPESEYESEEPQSSEAETEEETTEETTETSEEEMVEVNGISFLSARIGNVTKMCPAIGEDGSVTFRYYPNEGEVVTNAYVKGSWATNWDEFFYMSEDEDTGVWSTTVSLPLTSSYEYGIMVNEQWVGDETNPCNGNARIIRNPVYNSDGSVSIFYYPQGEDEVTLMYKKTEDSTYSSLQMTNDSVCKALLSAAISQDGTYEYYFVVNGVDTKDSNCVSPSFTITSLPEEDPSVKSPVVNGKEVTFSYYAPTAKSVLLAGEMTNWGAGAVLMDYNDKTGYWTITSTIDMEECQYKFIADGTWLTDPLNAEQRNGNSYVSLVEKEQESRYVIIEYTRLVTEFDEFNQPKKPDYEGWNIYSWNTGFGAETKIPFVAVGSKMVAMVPVTDTKDSISFCVRKSTAEEDWVEKDGNDHTAAIPLDQKSVKVQFVQGEGVVGNLPYNIGYETDVANGTITFCYRDDALFETYQEATLEGKVELIWNGQTYPMSYNADFERYEYTGELTDGEHYYGYLVDGELITDRFNARTMQVNDTTYSAYEYKKQEAVVTASIQPQSINARQNAVLSVTLSTESDIQVTEVTADLSALGMSSNFAIDPELMAGTIAVRDTVEAGVKQIPVTVKDQYGNLLVTTAEIRVTATAANDFDWDEAVIYFAVTDRFFDGNASNNDAYNDGTYNPSQGSMYHGGDFAGLTQKLDYLQELGVNTIWITPIVENIEDVFTCDGYTDQFNSGYHGYWASNFTKLNRHLGTEAELKALVEAVHARGMKLMVDVVLNHAGYATQEEFNHTYLSEKNMLRDSQTTVAGDDKKDALSGLPDFVTEDSEVRNLLIAWQSEWVSKYDIDYFRVDTVKHVEDTTWKAFKNALTAIDPDFKMIGEYAGAGYATSTGQLGTGQMDSLLDFDFNDQALSFVKGKLQDVENFLEKRNASINNTSTVGSFLGSHDEDGLMYRMMKESGFDSDKAYTMMKLAASLQITAKGQPVIYYGEELGQTGANNWPYQENRYDMDWTKANQSNEMLVHYRKLLAIRNANTDVFAKGTRSNVLTDEAKGILVMARSYAGESLYVGFNLNEENEQEVTLSLQANTRYTDLYSGESYETEQNGSVTVTIPKASDGGTIILKADRNVQPIRPVTSNTNNEAQTDSSDTESVSTTPAVVLEEPTYRRMDGTVVTGWSDVVAESIAEVLEQSVPLADSIGAAQSAPATYVDLYVQQTTVKVIPAETVQQMAQSGMVYRFHIEDKMLVEYTAFTLAELDGDLDLSALLSTDKDFGQNFQSLVFDPKNKTIYGYKIAAAFCLGQENAGKTAFVFYRNPVSQNVEFYNCFTADELGNIAIPNIDFTDIIVLYQ